MRQAHTIHPVVTIGQKGLTQAVGIEIERALDAHGLIKIKITGSDRKARQETFVKISHDHQAALINTLGFVGIFYRKPKKNKSDKE